ncbi:ribosome recycling factor [Candidatus Daviesbacteria bacterium RIFCSPLOWO2_02_FULL_40_8]|uniref:Ribosome-recycling factor n=1 Tax=Candidatus Daviesbacteria bacterium RIFCSPLOWO2_01_FULL_40_24 TaxID=1797787 RepID=A0A1F5MJJ1_9BACT|nr:MAG: ribosome recycling factor [Candidatus Daviesbacteria bacterium RIFCSPHIGHO2_01_FULL_41_45]OGE35454.1 MAG: ribosome recycling factor [Candidatus Daviesbacteria bacterium RIFCSPHIGHO2_02_FULL_41_14]OGE65544.1 MAG: ribosome recycling factor [Candidatus Daviesbacteria bacterium RIFCSPLOWO2_01_FULL_40_24]OGE67106.1 MAG: ribosome recycling factor [Candidatus Daviesbacteria bacterium RIFCSPLOWO2_02_FULL_40_8]
MDPVLIEAHQRIQSALEHLKVELSSIRAGRANPSLIENVPVSAYGGTMKLLEVGTISAPQPNLLTVQIWDVSILQDVIKSIQEANLGLNPSNDGTLIRLPIPQLTEERRVEYIKLSHQKMEGVRIEVRQIRQDIREGWGQEMESNVFGEDEFDRRAKILQELIDRSIGIIDELGKQKEAELMQI